MQTRELASPCVLRSPNCHFSKLNTQPADALFTLQRPPRDDRRKTRGQDGSLLLSCRTLSFPTACWLIPAHERLWHRPKRQSAQRERTDQRSFVSGRDFRPFGPSTLEEFVRSQQAHAILQFLSSRLRSRSRPFGPDSHHRKHHTSGPDFLRSRTTLPCCMKLSFSICCDCA